MAREEGPFSFDDQRRRSRPRTIKLAVKASSRPGRDRGGAVIDRVWLRPTGTATGFPRRNPGIETGSACVVLPGYRSSVRVEV